MLIKSKASVVYVCKSAKSNYILGRGFGFTLDLHLWTLHFYVNRRKFRIRITSVEHRYAKQSSDWRAHKCVSQMMLVLVYFPSNPFFCFRYCCCCSRILNLSFHLFLLFHWIGFGCLMVNVTREAVAFSAVFVMSFWLSFNVCCSSMSLSLLPFPLVIIFKLN